MTSGPNYNEDPDTEGSTLPPYGGRRESADPENTAPPENGGAATGGATGPVTGQGGDVDDPTQTPRGEHASPADEQPATDSEGTGSGPAMTGPSHQAGTGRAEDQT